MFPPSVDLSRVYLDWGRRNFAANGLDRLWTAHHGLDIVAAVLEDLPQHLTRAVLDVMASDPRFCPYIDMPLQHISDRMLNAMGRSLNRSQTLEKL
ncbi:MAG: hypothetical protein ABFS02_10505, partial [Pseudomonadota bacterium]